MLRKSYAAMQQFQRQISEVSTFEEFKRLFQLNGIDLVLQVRVFYFLANGLESYKGNDLRCTRFKDLSQDHDEARSPISLSLEDPTEISISKFQDRLMVPIKQSITSMRFQSN